MSQQNNNLPVDLSDNCMICMFYFNQQGYDDAARIARNASIPVDPPAPLALSQTTNDDVTSVDLQATLERTVR